MPNIDELIKNATEYCNENELSKNENGQFIYISKNGKSLINLPHILEDYKDWLIDKGILK